MNSISPVLAALPLIGGYTFSIIWYPSLYHSSRESGHRLYFRAAFYAVFLIVAAILVHMLLVSHTEWYSQFLGFIQEMTGADTKDKGPWNVLGIPTVFFLSFLLSVPLAALLNLMILMLGLQPFILKNAIRNNDFELLILRSFEKEIPTMFTLDTGKVYVGTIVRAPNPAESRKAIRIVPLLSGYRDKDTQAFRIETVYADLIEALEKPVDGRPEHLRDLSLEDIEVVFPSDSVCSSHLFDVRTYQTEFMTETNNEESTTTQRNTLKKILECAFR